MLKEKESLERKCLVELQEAEMRYNLVKGQDWWDHVKSRDKLIDKRLDFSEKLNIAILSAILSLVLLDLLKIILL